jgi:diguanylate cyclase (GGDEF)-like protein/PAS domain S-box-containing protein
VSDRPNLADFSDIWSQAIDGSATGLWDRDIASGTIRYSRSWHAILGYEDAPPANAIEESYTRVHPDDLAYVQATIAAHLDGKTPIYEVEHRLRCRDGRYIWVLSRGKVVSRDDAGRPLRMVGTTADITALRDLAERLRHQNATAAASARRLAALTQELSQRSEELAAAHRLARVGGWRWDVVNRCLWFSPEICWLMGRPASAVPVSYEQMRAMFHPDDHARAMARFYTAVAARKPVTLEYRILHTDGAVKHVLTHAEPVCAPDGRVTIMRGTTQDITPYRRIKAALRESEAARRASEALAFRVLEEAGDAVIVCDRAGTVTFANTKVTTALGLGASPVGIRAAELFAPAHGQVIRDALDRAITPGKGGHFELFWPPTGLWFEASLVAGESDVSLFLRDISEKRVARQRLHHAATHDSLTGAMNRATLFHRLAAQLAQQGPGERVALFCLDLDYFKEINDTHGHPVGDALLRLVVDRLQSCLRAGDLLARCGGDEFVVMQSAVKTAADAVPLAERIRAAMAPPFLVEGLSLVGRFSIGIAVSTPDITDADRLYRQADRALYVAKARARGRYWVFQPEMQIAFEAAHRLRADLACALTRGEFSLAFQPIMRIAPRRAVAVEALLRWHHPERGLIPPADFIATAEESGLIAEIGAWALHEACAAARRWESPLRVSVNVSPRQFEIGDLYKTVAAALRDTGLPAGRLALEVTETVLLSQNAANLRLLRALRDLGVQLVLDDFGTGYSSLAYLDTFKFDVIKIDKSFVSRIRRPGDRQPIFEAIMGIAGALQLPLIAEGIETEAQLDYIRRFGCDLAQGFLFARPMTAAALRDFFTHRVSAG